MNRDGEQAVEAPSGPSLAALQQWMQAVLLHPEGVISGIESIDARQLLDVAPDDLETVISPSRTLSSVERLSIYWRAYSARLLECLRASYPTLLFALEEEAFDTLARGYLQANPSRTYTLDKLGEQFSRFLQETRPDSEGQASGEECLPSWPDFLIDLARLDWAVACVFDGPGAEKSPGLSTAQIAAVQPDRWPDARLKPTPSLRLLEFRYPVNAYFTAARSGARIPWPEPQATYLALSRRDYVVFRHELSAEQFRLLSALVEGRCVAEAIEAAAATCEVSGFTKHLHAWFRQWTAAGFFQAIE